MLPGKTSRVDPSKDSAAQLCSVTLGMSSLCFCSPHGQAPITLRVIGTGRQTVLRGGQVILLRKDARTSFGDVTLLHPGWLLHGLGRRLTPGMRLHILFLQKVSQPSLSNPRILSMEGRVRGGCVDLPLRWAPKAWL